MDQLKHFKVKTRLLIFIIGLAILTACTTNIDSKQKKSLNYQLIESTKLIEDTSYYKIDYQYPYFKSEDAKVSHSLALLNDSIQTFLDDAELTYWGLDANGAVELIKETGTCGLYELVNRYEILDTTNNLISLKFETYSYALGAHGFTALNTYNLDLETGVLLKLSDVVDLSGDSKLTAFNQLLVESFVNTEDCFNEQPKVDSTYNKFAISPEFLVVYFEAYELGPYSCGSAEILVSIDDLKEIGIWKR